MFFVQATSLCRPITSKLLHHQQTHNFHNPIYIQHPTTTMTNKRSKRSAALMLLTALTSNVASSAYTFPGPNPRIVGGQDTVAGEYRFFSSWSTSCGATVIHDDILLTAAHVCTNVRQSDGVLSLSADNHFSHHVQCYLVCSQSVIH